MGNDSSVLDHFPPAYSCTNLIGNGQTPTNSYSQAEAPLLRLHSQNRSSYRANKRFKADGGAP